MWEWDWEKEKQRGAERKPAEENWTGIGLMARSGNARGRNRECQRIVLVQHDLRAMDILCIRVCIDTVRVYVCYLIIIIMCMYSEFTRYVHLSDWRGSKSNAVLET